MYFFILSFLNCLTLLLPCCIRNQCGHCFCHQLLSFAIVIVRMVSVILLCLKMRHQACIARMQKQSQEGLKWW